MKDLFFSTSKYLLALSLLFIYALSFQSCDDDEMQDLCECNLNYQPVCVDGVLYANECIAICNGHSFEAFQVCSPSQIDSTAYLGCVTTMEYFPVCAGGITYPNPGMAVCAGWELFDGGECGEEPCVCDAEYNPVCVIDSLGQQLTFSNSCMAECEGYSSWTMGECGSFCTCPEIYDPVCVATPSGSILTFSNACFAECEGFDENIFYTCTPTNLNCPNGIYGEIVDYTGLSGCGLVIETPLYGTLEPVSVPDSITLEAGMSINFEFEIFDGASICMVGQLVEITCLEYN